MSISRLVSIPAISLAAMLWLAACAPPDGARECVNGTFCPPGTECSGDGMTCVTAGGCGNAIRSPTEECDDGNVNDGDGCSHLCNDERCGDGDIDVGVGEVCDDGNNVGGDGCSADCTSDETCGNGIPDPAAGEVCDDGNNVDGDGCSADCASDETCGNGIPDPAAGEVCDDGIPFGGPCRSDCKGGEGCGNGEVNPAAGEECDDGDDDSTDDCVTGPAVAGVYECRIARCGDGIVAIDASSSRREECDGGAPDHSSPGPVETATCNLDCTSSSCGDGKVNGAAGERCDDGNLVDGDGCDHTCTLTACGNGVVTAGEQCDDGNLVDGDGCDHTCTLTACGNGELTPNTGEECDDGNLDSSDDCVIDTAYQCKISRCGDGIVATNASGLRKEECDGGAPDHSSPGPVETATCNLDCTSSSCGDGKLNRTAGERCDDGNLVDGDGCEHDCTVTPAP